MERQKSIRILQRWFDILEDRFGFNADNDYDDNIELHLLLINQAIKILNKKDGGNRKFTFTVEEI